jgi:hypothetical protein
MPVPRVVEDVQSPNVVYPSRLLRPEVPVWLGCHVPSLTQLASGRADLQCLSVGKESLVPPPG